MKALFILFLGALHLSAHAEEKELEITKEVKESLKEVSDKSENEVKQHPKHKGGSFALYYDYGYFEMHDPADSASHEDKAYMNTNVGSIKNGWGAGILVNLPVSMNLFSLPTLGFGVKKSHLTSKSLNLKVDIENTNENESDDITLKTASRDFLQGIIFVYAIKFLTVGLGWEDGKMVYEIKDKNGESKTVKKDYAFPYLHLSLSTTNMFPKGRGPFVSVTASLSARSISTRHGRYSGDNYSAAIGYMF